MSEITSEVMPLCEKYRIRNGIAHLKALRLPVIPYREARRQLDTLEECEKPSIGGAADRKHPNDLDDFLVLLWTVKMSLERREEQLRQQEKVPIESLEKVEAEIRTIEKLQKAPNEGSYRDRIPEIVWREPVRTKKISKPETLKAYLDAFVDFCDELEECQKQEGAAVVLAHIARSVLHRYKRMDSYNGDEDSLSYLKKIKNSKDFLKNIRSVSKANGLDIQKINKPAP